MRIDPDILMKLIRQHFNAEGQKLLTCTRWKDGIDIDQPVYAIEAFAEAVAGLSQAVGEPMDPRFVPTKHDLAALREDAAFMRGAGLPVTVNVAPAVLYMAWPNSKYDSSNPESSRWRCISFNIPKPE